MKYPFIFLIGLIWLFSPFYAWGQKTEIAKDAARALQHKPVLQITTTYYGGCTPQQLQMIAQDYSRHLLQEAATGQIQSITTTYATAQPTLQPQIPLLLQETPPENASAAPNPQPKKGLQEKYLADVAYWVEDFIREYGHAPSSLYHIPSYKHNMNQQIEACIGRAWRRALYQANQQANPSPQLRHLQELANKYSAGTTTPEYILAKTKEFMEQHDRRPRNTIYHDKAPINKDEMTPEEQQEHLLGTQLTNLLRAARLGKIPTTPVIEELNALVAAYAQRPRTQQLTRLLEELQTFVNRHDRPPHSYITLDGHKVSPKELSGAQRYERSLYARVRSRLTRSSQSPQTPEDEHLLQTIRNLMKKHKAYSSAGGDEPIQSTPFEE